MVQQSMQLRVVHELPTGLLETPAENLLELLGGPTLIHLSGVEPLPLFVSTLLHGNETTGFEALQSLLREHAGAPLPRALSIFIGNVAAAAENRRVLVGQPDFNRIWPDAAGEVQATTPQAAARLARQVIDEMRRRGVMMALDLHNTSGRNPPHACVNSLRADCLALASQFAQRVLHFSRPHGVLSMAFTPLCPAVTAECGPPGLHEGVQLTRRYLDYCLQLKEPPDQWQPAEHMQLYRSVARVELRPGVVFGFGDVAADVDFVREIDGYNWRELPAGTHLATVNRQIKNVLPAAFYLHDEVGNDVSHLYLQQKNNEIVTATAVTPAMLSTDPDIVRQDCLCYFLERVC